MRSLHHTVIAAAIAVAIPSVVWLVNGILPGTAVVLGIVVGLAYWYWRPDPTI